MADSERDARWMRRALALAEAAAVAGEVPVGAVVVRGEVELATGANRREADRDPTAHAELLAVREAARTLGDWRLEGCDVFVTLEPCAMCAGAMVLARIERCVYAAPDPKGGFCGTLGELNAHPRLNHRYEVVGGVLADESAALLRGFFAERRKRRP